MFWQAGEFNADISGWNVSSVTDMAHMFNQASSFNQMIGGWDVSSVTDMKMMFVGAASFNHTLCGHWAQSTAVRADMFTLSDGRICASTNT